MSKIAEQKALEEYPIYYFFEKREGYIRGYDQGVADEREKLMAEMSDIDIYHQGYEKAIQDFLEKACEWLEDTQLENFICFDDGICFNNEKLVERFKNYMQDEM